LEFFGPTMRFSMKEDSNAEIAIYNVNGRLVRRLTARLSSGESTITWDGKDDRGSRAASGVYFARVQANEQAGQGKLVVVR
ncbi:MAG TPA: FlgD immunoglobulin-like domain containing protein, partial [bacterium]|nr:FlgD immunoglobulin-like domain containing protein [bacterium]